MANDIVAGLFGLSPDQVRQQQLAEQQKAAYSQAQMNPFDRAGMMMAQGGAGLVDIAAPAFGLPNREVAAAQTRQEALQGLDLTSPESIQNAGESARQRGDFQLAAQLGQLANQRAAEIQTQQVQASKMALEGAQTAKANADANKLAPPTAPKIESYEKDGYKVTVQFNPTTNQYDEIGRNKIKVPAIDKNSPDYIDPVILRRENKEIAAVRSASTQSQQVREMVDKLVKHPGADAATGYSAYVPSLPNSDAKAYETIFSDLQSQVTKAGLEASRQGGSIGAMTEKEWGIVGGMLANINLKAGKTIVNTQLKQVQDRIDTLLANAGQTYADTYHKTPPVGALVDSSPKGPEVIPSGLPTGATFIGYSPDKKKIYQTPDGKKWMQ